MFLFFNGFWFFLRLEIRKSVRKEHSRYSRNIALFHSLSDGSGRNLTGIIAGTRVGKKASELRKVKFASCRRIKLKLQHTQAAQKPARAITAKYF